MKRVILFLILALMALTAAKAFANPFPPEQEKQIRVVINGFYEAFNQHDPKKVGEYFTPDGDFRTPWNQWGKNRDEVEKITTALFAGMMKNAHFEKSINSIRMIKPDIAFVDVESVITGMQTAANTQYAPLHHHVVYVLVKREGKWQFRMARPF